MMIIQAEKTCNRHNTRSYSSADVPGGARTAYADTETTDIEAKGEKDK